MDIKNSIMAKISFSLNNRNKTIKGKEYSIYIRYKFRTQVDLNKPIGFKVIPEYWNKKSQEVRNRSEITNRNKINDLIKRLNTCTLFIHGS